MTDLLVSLGSWNWFVLGIVLMVLELAAPGAFLLWFGIAAVVVGLLSLVVDWGWQAQVVAFALLALVAVLGGRMLQRRYGGSDDSPFLNRRGQAYVGRELVLAEPIVQGQGRVSIDDTVWRVKGPDAAAGAKITVERVEGAVLVVRPVGDRQESVDPPTGGEC